MYVDNIIQIKKFLFIFLNLLTRKFYYAIMWLRHKHIFQDKRAYFTSVKMYAHFRILVLGYGVFVSQQYGAIHFSVRGFGCAPFIFRGTLWKI